MFFLSFPFFFLRFLFDAAAVSDTYLCNFVHAPLHQGGRWNLQLLGRGSLGGHVGVQSVRHEQVSTCFLFLLLLLLPPPPFPAPPSLPLVPFRVVLDTFCRIRLPSVRAFHTRRQDFLSFMGWEGARCIGIDGYRVAPRERSWSWWLWQKDGGEGSTTIGGRCVGRVMSRNSRHLEINVFRPPPDFVSSLQVPFFSFVFRILHFAFCTSIL